MFLSKAHPLHLLIGVSTLLAIHSVVAGYLGYDISWESEAIGYSALTFGIAWWSFEDAGKRKYHRPFEFGAFMFFMWPLLLPVYLYETRKFGGVKTLVGLLIIYWLPWALGWVAYYANPQNS